MNRPIEPGLLRVFRYFTGVAMVYFALVWVFAFVETGQVFSLQIQSTLNFATNLALFGYLSWSWLARRLKRGYLPLALLAATVIPVFSNLIYLAAPPETDLFRIIVRSWLVLPILLVPLVLIAWQYRFRYVVAFIIFTTLIELTSLYPLIDRLEINTLVLLGVPLLRAFAFGTVGHIVTRLIETQRLQRQDLMRANLQLARHAQTREQLAASRERNRLARELHDTLAHTLSGLAVNLEAMKTLGLPPGSELGEMLDHSLAITRTGLGETRRALKDLRAQPLEDLGLGLAICSQARLLADRANLELAVDVPAEIEGLSPAVEQNLYRIALEGLENITRHAGARRASLSLKTPPGGLVLTIQDDGRGFEPGPVDSNGVDDLQGFGLQMMRERAEEIGARFSFQSAPGAGTLLQVRLGNAAEESL
jgi:signal transduction histidine kinase